MGYAAEALGFEALSFHDFSPFEVVGSKLINCSY